jgi:N-methylhydantoinase A/oxoprolinase/acetone carboxylase beta subunit
MSYRLGVDVGGTFTDLVLVSPDGVARIRAGAARSPA